MHFDDRQPHDTILPTRADLLEKVAPDPVSALDVSNARRVTDLIARLQQQEGVALLFISHGIAVVERVTIMFQQGGLTEGSSLFRPRRSMLGIAHPTSGKS